MIAELRLREKMQSPANDEIPSDRSPATLEEKASTPAWPNTLVIKIRTVLLSIPNILLAGLIVIAEHIDKVLDIYGINAY